MGNLWQYQQFAELPPADRLVGDWDERTDPGKWAPKLPDIYFPARYLSKAIQPHISTAPPLSEKFSWLQWIDKWGPILPAIRYENRLLFLSRAIEPHLSVEPRVTGSWLERMTSDKWEPSLPARRYERAYLTAAVLSYPTYTEEIWRYSGDAALNFILDKKKTRF
jgi:hypothetical protein